ncbi:MAG: M20/M25/M40 family metallo-hydrolase [Synergistaceae bacterium]|nr:M20/M25/M40 family metallo-hydrolase [Synergistaceae bacterium]
MKLGDKIRNFAIELTKVGSIVGSRDENDATRKVMERFEEMEYFRHHPDNLFYVDAVDDPLERKSVVAVLKGEKGSSKKTVVLIGHTDTVGTSDYGEIEAYATNPDSLPDKLAEVTIPADARKDLESGKYLFGRGLFDMKSGVSILMHIVEELSLDIENLEGNVIFSAVCDEEGGSAGMLSVVPKLVEIMEKEELDYRAVIDTDYSAPRYEGDETRYIYVGTVGKLMPSFYIVGSETHAGDPYKGIDPNQISSAIMEEMNLVMAYADEAEGEVTVPPVSLRQQDLKTEYSVQTAKTSYVYFNFSTHTSTPDQMMEIVKEGALRAFRKTIDRLKEEFSIYSGRSGFEHYELPWKERVLSYSELYQKVKNERGEELDKALSELEARLLADRDVDEREHSLRMVEMVHSMWSDKDPVVIAYYSPPYYPHIYVSEETQKERDLLAAVEEAQKNCESNYKIKMRKFYPYISDLSYAAAPREEGAVESLKDNMPGFGSKYKLPLEEMQKLNLPVVNIGPFGKDAHKFTERIEVDYSYNVTPGLVRDTILNLLK